MDLAAFRTIVDVRAQAKTWLKVRKMLDSRQMPPKDEEQPTDVQREVLQKWVRSYLASEAAARAGDPGPVILRRLSNAEYTYSVRDLTGVQSLDPTREFPVDGAAGEGFTNTGGALVMSPSLVMKYLDSAKEITAHATLLPDGIRFSPHATRRDKTDALLVRIRDVYKPFSGDRNGSVLRKLGIIIDTKQGGRFPVEHYLAATLEEREALMRGDKTPGAVAQERGLNARYLNTLWQTLATDATPSGSLLLDRLRGQWRSAKLDESLAMLELIARWQTVLWKFSAIGYIGRAGGPTAWMEPVNPLVEQQDFRLKVPASADGADIILTLAAGDAGDGNSSDYVVWENPRREATDGPSVNLRDVAGLRQRLAERRRVMLSKTTLYLAAASEINPDPNAPKPNVAELATKHDVDALALQAWINYLDLDKAQPVKVTGHLPVKQKKIAGYDFVNAWGPAAPPSEPCLMANSSDQPVRIPGLVRGHSVVAHPSPSHFVAAGWRSPIDGVVRVEARVSDAHPDCGNGQEWVVQYRTKLKTSNLWQGEFNSRGSATMPAKNVAVRKGELVSFILGPRNNNHGCDLTDFDLVITETRGEKRIWDLAKEVSENLHESNPHMDGYGNKNTWHFYQGATAGLDRNDHVGIPRGSLLGQWQAASNSEKRMDLAGRVQSLVLGKQPSEKTSPDAILYQQLMDLDISMDFTQLLRGVEPDARFGRHPLGHEVDANVLVVKAPSVVEFRVPAKLVVGRSLIVKGRLGSNAGREGSVQLRVGTSRPDLRDVSPSLPILVADQSNTRRRVERSFNEFRDLFPVAVCYGRIVPVDEPVTMTLFYRQDEHLKQLLLDDTQVARLDRLWEELLYVSQEPLRFEMAFEQVSEFVTQDRPDLVEAFKPLAQPTRDRADGFRQHLVDTEIQHMRAVLEIAERAWRRPLTGAERQSLRVLYEQLRRTAIPHDEAIRLTLARMLTSPNFLYRRERPVAGETATRVSDQELASRLSYFLWSSLPDAELRRVADGGRLTNETALLAQTRRMLDDDRTRRLAVEFACQWLHIRNFDENAEKNESLYPQFVTLREAMYEETVRFFEEMFRHDGSILDMLDADDTFLNETLAKHYGIEGVSGPEWRRVNGVRKSGRGGVLSMATVLASQSGASRTSPILRGNWIFETLLGERLPRPPADVPKLPESVPNGASARELIEQHSSVPACAKCHARIDPYGFALEQYDAIGRLRPAKVDTRTKLADGTTIEGLDGLRTYLKTERRDDVVRQFCRKLLGFALGREVQLSDEPLLDDMATGLAKNDYRFSVAVKWIVLSKQFRMIRGNSTPARNDAPDKNP